MKNRINSYILEIVVLLGAYAYWLTEGNLDNSIVVCAVVLVYYGFRFIYELGKKIVFLDAVILMAIIQWLFVPAIVYKVESGMFLFEDTYSEMPIGQEEYFGIVFPATFMFFAAIHFPIVSMRQEASFFKEKLKEYLKDMHGVPIVLFGIGFFVKATSSFLPLPGFLSFLLENVMYVGFFYALFVKTRYNTIIYILTIGWMLRSILGGALSTFVLWSVFIASLIFMVRKTSLFSKVGLLVASLAMVYVLQSVKTTYREIVWRGEGTNYSIEEKFDLFIGLIGDRFSGDDEDKAEESMNENLIRFNQGFLIAHAIDYVPAIEPFAGGETVTTALMASFIPRFLWPNKPVAGGRANMHRFTALRMVGNTSMNISALGDGYVNYGPVGVTIFLCLFGVSLNLLNSKLFRLAMEKPSIVLWIPTIYIAVVVVETDFVTVFNHAIKSSIFVWVIYLFAKKIIGVQI